MRQHHTQHPGSLMGHGPPKSRRFTNPAGRARCAGRRTMGIAANSNSAGSALSTLPGFLLAHARHHGAVLVDSSRFGHVGQMSAVLGAA